MAEEHSQAEEEQTNEPSPPASAASATATPKRGRTPSLSVWKAAADESNNPNRERLTPAEIEQALQIAEGKALINAPPLSRRALVLRRAIRILEAATGEEPPLPF